MKPVCVCVCGVEAEQHRVITCWVGQVKWCLQSLQRTHSDMSPHFLYFLPLPFTFVLQIWQQWYLFIYLT